MCIHTYIVLYIYTYEYYTTRPFDRCFLVFVALKSRAFRASHSLCEASIDRPGDDGRSGASHLARALSFQPQRHGAGRKQLPTPAGEER